VISPLASRGYQFIGDRVITSLRDQLQAENHDHPRKTEHAKGILSSVGCCTVACRIT
jgi:hypothetical protein